MLRTVLRATLGWILGLFFRRIDVSGANRVPPRGPVIFAINHPNGLVDPLLLLTFVPRPVSFLAKAPLFELPILGWVIRRLDTIPVYRRQDQADLRQNRATFERARDLLGRGGTIAISPEGTSHSDPGLRPFKTGAARIALGATLGTLVAIVPVGLFYTEKAVFRSANLDPGHPLPRAVTAAGLIRSALWLVFRIVGFLPLTLPGLLLHYPAYWAIGHLAARYAGAHDDVLATAKIIGAVLLFPLTWIGAGFLAGITWGPAAGLMVALGAPLSGYAALKLVERFDRFVTGTRAIGLYLARPEQVRQLSAERDRLRDDLAALGKTLGILA